ncbi:MAG: hypothetical protein ACTHMM_22330 [Agriterribacter sp.]
MSNENKFWQWFIDNQFEYLYLNDIDTQKKEFLLESFLNSLHEYCDHLYFQISNDPYSDIKEIIISAEGDTKYFEKVETLVNAAPPMKEWKVIAFKQPMGVSFVTEYEGLLLDPKEIWFLPLNNAKQPTMIGVRICIKDYTPQEENKFKNGMYQVLDHILGEKARATLIDYFDIDNLLKYDIKKDGLIELFELPEYIKWKKAS